LMPIPYFPAKSRMGSSNSLEFKLPDFDRSDPLRYALTKSGMRFRSSTRFIVRHLLSRSMS
jgi:hypothetical protein